MSSDDFEDKEEAPLSLTSTIDNALKLVEKDPKSFNDWRVKELGLTLTLFGLAELQSRRIQSLSGLVYELEKEVFAVDNIRQLEPTKLIKLYEMGTASLRESAEYVKNTIKSIDWNQVEAQLIQAAALSEAEDSTTGSSNVKDVISDLLSKLTVNMNDKVKIN
jgi:hypothetical protein